MAVAKEKKEDVMELPAEAGLGAEQQVPPAYSEQHDRLSLRQNGFAAGAAVTGDGRVNINISQTSAHLVDAIAPTLRNQLAQDGQAAAAGAGTPVPSIPPGLGGVPGSGPPPRLNVVIQIVGSRGDVQPFIAMGLTLKNKYGHRVRLATHGTFKSFVEESGLEFFNIGGDPAELMAYMVKNPGLMPSIDTLKSGEITKRRKGVEQIIWGCWRSCIEAGDGTGSASTAERLRDGDGAAADGSLVIEPDEKPFVADAIIANPPSFAHIHIAEKLGVPLHMMFTMPWSPTRYFPQPLANIQSTNTDPVTTNYVSYALVEMMTWQGVGDVINKFRAKVLSLEPLSLLWAPAVISRLRIPFTYCWSPALIPKPIDWGSHIDIAGFYFLDLATNYTPSPELAAFLAAGPAPVYIGFGSIVIDDPDKLTKIIFEAVAAAGVRALVSKGWGGLGAEAVGKPDDVFMLDNVPHDWLFERVSIVCHHGGAGTTAAGIKAGKPTIVIPFFGDQPFWGAMVARAGAGPDPIPWHNLTGECLANAIRMANKPEMLDKARQLGAKIRKENGTEVGADIFHRRINVDRLRCSVVPSRVAVWRVRRTKVQLSAFAAATLVESGHLQYADLKLFRAREYSTEDEPWDPISALTSALLGDLGAIGMNVADLPREIMKAAKSKSQTNGKGDEGEDGPSGAKSSPPAGHLAGAAAAQPVELPSAPVGADKPSSVPSSSSDPGLAKKSLDHAATPTADRKTAQTSSPRHSLHMHRASSSESRPGPKPDHRTINKTDDLQDQMERSMGTSHVVGNVVAVGMKTPMNFCLGLARGFRNAPKLYHDDTVRPVEKVTNLKSGLKLAGKELGFGFFDGITGVVTQPIRGAQKEGALGALKGIGKGFGGLVFKIPAGLWSLPAYTLAGVNAELRHRFATSAHNYIVASRVATGTKHFAESSVEERKEVQARWDGMKTELQAFYDFKSQGTVKSKDASPRGQSWIQKRQAFYEEKRKKREMKRSRSGPNPEPTSPRSSGEAMSSTRTSDDQGDVDMEHCIQKAVRETSTGDAMEDARVEQAIRASVRQMRKTSSLSTIAASASEPALPTTGLASSGPSPASATYPPDVKQDVRAWAADHQNLTDEEYQALVEGAVRASISEHSGIRKHDSVDDTDEDDTTPGQGLDGHSSDDEQELKRAMEESERVHEAEQARYSSLKSEEDAVLERTLKQSLAEEEQHRQRLMKEHGDDQKALQQALKESLEAQGQRGAGGKS